MCADVRDQRSVLIQRLRNYVNYVDVLSLALAYACTEEKEKESFASDPRPWHEAVHEICERFKNEVPELKLVFFDDRKMVLWSDEVDHWRRCLRMGRLITFYLMPLDHDYEMTIKQKQRITELYQKKVSRYESQIREMAKIFVKHLKR